MGEEREVGARDNTMGMEPDQLAFWMEVLDAGMGFVVMSLIFFVQRDATYSFKWVSFATNH